jgi:hypothetical protein
LIRPGSLGTGHHDGLGGIVVGRHAFVITVARRRVRVRIRVLRRAATRSLGLTAPKLLHELVEEIAHSWRV